MTDWRADADLRRELFNAGLASNDIHTDDGKTFVGPLEVPELGLTVDILIEVPANFPYAAPRVRPLGGEGGLSWHREPNGRLCLYTDDDANAQPWADPDGFLERVRHWYRRDAANWEGDPPDLDLERYWTSSPGFVLYDRTELTDGATVRMLREDRVLRARPAGGRGAKRVRDRGLVVDVGELATPVRDWHTLADALAHPGDVETQISRGQLGYLLVRYSRGGNLGVLVLDIVDNSPIEFAAMASGDASPDTLRLRSGPQASLVANSKVAVVGAGAVGSHVVDLLVRAGVGHITVLDGDVVRPGNLVRHSASPHLVGVNKAVALAEMHAKTLNAVPWSPTEVTARPEHLRYLDETEALLVEHDLVVDSSAHGTPTGLLTAAAESLGRPMVSVALQRGGGIARVDRSPMGAGGTRLDPVPPLDDEQPELREAGCGDPVSPTPAWACEAAAALATAVALDVLGQGHSYPASTIQVLVPQPDEPYDHVRILP